MFLLGYYMADVLEGKLYMDFISHQCETSVREHHKDQGTV